MMTMFGRSWASNDGAASATAAASSPVLTVDTLRSLVILDIQGFCFNNSLQFATTLMTGPVPCLAPLIRKRLESGVTS